jgi:uncharacterized membrane protein YkvA (DUF1232 family)
MPYRLTIELSDRDLRHFRRELQRARESVSIADDDEILGAASEFVAKLRQSDLPDFVKERLAKIDTLLAMLTDPDWPLSDEERSPVLAALAYACDPEDIIPDEIPGIGLLDDAVMVELVFRELQHELEAYEDFRRYRKSLPREGRQPAPHPVRQQLERRRAQLVLRMHRRRAAAKKALR